MFQALLFREDPIPTIDDEGQKVTRSSLRQRGWSKDDLSALRPIGTVEHNGNNERVYLLDHIVNTEAQSESLQKQIGLTLPSRRAYVPPSHVYDREETISLSELQGRGWSLSNVRKFLHHPDLLGDGTPVTKTISYFARHHRFGLDRVLQAERDNYKLRQKIEQRISAFNRRSSFAQRTGFASSNTTVSGVSGVSDRSYRSTKWCLFPAKKVGSVPLR